MLQVLRALSLMTGSRQYPRARPLASENPVWPEARHWCFPWPQHGHDYDRLHQDHRLQSLLSCVLVAYVLVTTRRVRCRHDGSLTAFQSVFASQGSEVRERGARPWYSSTVPKLRRHPTTFEDHNLEHLPSIPSPTLSGMRTFISGSRLGSDDYCK